MSNDLVSDTLTRIRNAQRAGHKTVRLLHSKLTARILDVLQKEGFIISYEADKLPGKKSEHKAYKVFLKYDRNGFPAISELVRMSKPGLRVYASKEKLPTVHSGMGVSIISTSKGVLSDREAKKQGIGGEILATVF